MKTQIEKTLGVLQGIEASSLMNETRALWDRHIANLERAIAEYPPEPEPKELKAEPTTRQLIQKDVITLDFSVDPRLDQSEFRPASNGINEQRIREPADEVFVEKMKEAQTVSGITLPFHGDLLDSAHFYDREWNDPVISPPLSRTVIGDHNLPGQQKQGRSQPPPEATSSHKGKGIDSLVHPENPKNAESRYQASEADKSIGSTASNGIDSKTDQLSRQFESLRLSDPTTRSMGRNINMQFKIANALRAQGLYKPSDMEKRSGRPEEERTQRTQRSEGVAKHRLSSDATTQSQVPAHEAQGKKESTALHHPGFTQDPARAPHMTGPSRSETSVKSTSPTVFKDLTMSTHSKKLDHSETDKDEDEKIRLAELDKPTYQYFPTYHSKNMGSQNPAYQGATWSNTPSSDHGTGPHRPSPRGEAARMANPIAFEHTSQASWKSPSATTQHSPLQNTTNTMVTQGPVAGQPSAENYPGATPRPQYRGETTAHRGPPPAYGQKAPSANRATLASFLGIRTHPQPSQANTAASRGQAAQEGESNTPTTVDHGQAVREQMKQNAEARSWYREFPQTAQPSSSERQNTASVTRQVAPPSGNTGIPPHLRFGEETSMDVDPPSEVAKGNVPSQTTDDWDKYKEDW